MSISVCGVCAPGVCIEVVAKELKMRPLRTFTVKPNLPDALLPLVEIANNLWWSWNGSAQDLFRRLDPMAWARCNHNPVAVLGAVPQSRLVKVAGDEGFVAHLQRVHSELKSYLENRGWWSRTYGISS